MALVLLCRAERPCSLPPRSTQQQQQPQPGISRRQLSSAAAALLVLPALLAAAAAPSQAADSNVELNARLKKYIKKKRAEPVDTYVPVLLVARQKLTQADALMVRDTSGARQLLREGVFKSLRDAVRAVAQFVTPEEERVGGLSAPALALSGAFFEALEVYDSQLQKALRSGDLDLPAAREALNGTLAALDSVLAVVPDDVMVRAKRVAEASLQSASPKAAADGDDDAQPAGAQPAGALSSKSAAQLERLLQ